LIETIILALWGMGSLMIATHLSMIVVFGHHLRSETWYVLVLFMVSVAGLCSKTLYMFFPVTWLGFLLVFLSPILGYGLYRLDQFIIGKYRKKTIKTPFLLTSADKAQANQKQINLSFIGSTMLVLVAIFEEIVYRGVLLHIVFDPEQMMTSIFMVMILVSWFALIHVWYRWVNVLAKAPLGVVTTLVTLVGGGVIASIITHVTFNYFISLRMKRGV